MISYKTSESVTEGHPDKICDQVSDAILDELIQQDPDSRVAIECLTTTGLIVVAGEVTTEGYAEVQDIVRDTLEDIGYTDPRFGLTHESVGIQVSIHEQSPDIAQGVDTDEQGAGDQGMMFGYACDETDELMPLPITLAHRLTERLAHVRKEDVTDYLGPDGKAQVTVEYHDGEPQRVDAVVVSTQHREGVSQDQLHEDVKEHVIRPVCGAYLDEDTEYYINPTGKFVIGGPRGDSGLTGRKIVVDTYGGVGRVGGGAFSGKDPSKVDRSASYAARYVAKNIVAAGLASECEVQVDYAIGVPEPVAVDVETFGTSNVSENEISRLIRDRFDLRPAAIIDSLDLQRPIYEETATYGHFGRDAFTWEQTDKAAELRRHVQE